MAGSRSQVPGQLRINGSEVEPVAELHKPTALVHILTPEFQNLNPDDFSDIPEGIVLKAGPEDLEEYLFWPYVPKSSGEARGVSSFSYRTLDEGFQSVAVTPEEHSVISESIERLVQRRFSTVLTQRDKALRKETGDETRRARTEEDIRVAERGAMRSVIERKAAMEALINSGINPKLDLLERFIEMTEGRNANLSRGSREAVSLRFEDLRTTIFDDMLDAVALQKGWSEEMTTRAKRIIQKRLYISGSIRDRIDNFRDMLALAHTYYRRKRAMVLTKIDEARSYQRANPDVMADIIATDEQRRREKEARES